MEHYDNVIRETSEWSHAGIFADEGITGTSTAKRMSFNRMMSQCRRGKIDRILCKSISRFARNTVDCLDAVRELKGLGIAVYFEKENIDTIKEQSEFMMSLYSSFAQAESESMSANVKMGMRMSMAKGKVNFRYDKLLGYERGEDGNPVIAENEAKIVRRIYQSYLAGYSLDKIRNELIAEGIPTAMGIKEWSKAGLHSILTNERYMGDALLQKYYVTDCLTKKQKRNRGELPQYYVENSHPAIISRYIWNRVQEEMARRANKRKKAINSGKTEHGKYSAKYALTEKLICGECKTPYRRCTWARNGKKRIVWRCISRLENGTKYCYDSPTLDEYKIQDAVVMAINRLRSEKDDIMDTLLEGIKRALGTNADDESSKLRDKKRILKEETNELINRMNNGESLESLEDEMRRVKEAQDQVDELIAEYDRQQMILDRENNRMSELKDILEAMPICLTEYDDTLVMQTIDYITVDNKEQLTVHFSIGAEISAPIV